MRFGHSSEHTNYWRAAGSDKWIFVFSSGRNNARQSFPADIAHDHQLRAHCYFGDSERCVCVHGDRILGDNMIAWSGEALVSAGAVILSLYFKHREDKKERAGVAQAIRDRDQKLTFILNEHKPHTHTETDEDEPLIQKNIRYPSVKINGT